MHIIREYNGLRQLDNSETKYFINMYDINPDDFMSKNYDKYCYTTDDLTNMYVVSVEAKTNKPKTIEEGKYCVSILDIYTPNTSHKATLDYCGHIAFVDIKDSSNDRITLLYKDDECFPQPFNDWYDYYIKEKSDDYGIVPSKLELLEVIKLMIKAHCQNPDLEIDINESNIIILQGL
jgi:hypothetical protein